VNKQPEVTLVRNLSSVRELKGLIFGHSPWFLALILQGPIALGLDFHIALPNVGDKTYLGLPGHPLRVAVMTNPSLVFTEWTVFITCKVRRPILQI
jgi:hypothetical protein